MYDLIDRQAAIDALGTITMYKNSIPFDTAVMKLQKLPTTEKRGRWKRIKAYPDLIFCDECGEPFKSNQNDVWNYCPNCGAKMED